MNTSVAGNEPAMDILSLRVGLANMGNTCFLNSVLQALRLTPPLAELFLTKEIVLRPESKKGTFVLAFQTILRDIWKIVVDKHPITMVPRGFFESLIRVVRETDDEWYRPGQQCCAAETIQYILDSLHDGIHRPVRMELVGNASSAEDVSQIKALESWTTSFQKEYSPIVNDFYGQTQTRVRCDKCGNVSERYEPWLILPVPVPGAGIVGGPTPTLSQCLQEGFAQETLDDYQCDNCNIRGKATKTLTISRLPRIVIVHIKRFTNAGHKVIGKIDWNMDDFDFRSVMAFRRDPFRNESPYTNYETYAVIEHMGNTQGGHYTMYGRQADTWHEYDDNSVTEVAPERVVNMNSYIVFFMPKTESAEMKRQFANTVIECRKKSAS